jgi:hypothetical protein
MLKKHPRAYAIRRYYDQKAKAKERNIPFLLTFEEWDTWWLQHGVDRNIKRTINGNTLCMCRYNDSGSYELSNIYCDTIRSNTSTGNLLNPRPGQPKKKIYTPYGIFDSRKTAAEQLKINPSTISRKLISDPINYHYL